MRRGSETISPTAHYTGYVWARNGLGPRELATYEGRVMHTGLAPLNWVSSHLGGPSLDAMLLARHRRIDELLDEAIGDGRVTQVVEVAAGMSPRGYRFMQRYAGRLTYVEADLPGMIERKRSALSKMTLADGHRLVEVDALKDGGPGSLPDVLDTLDHTQGIALVTEGLINYLPTPTLLILWSRIATLLGEFESGLYLSDLVQSGALPGPVERAAAAALGVFVRSGTFLHFDTDAEAERALVEAGFAIATVHDPGDSTVRVIEALSG